VAAASGRRCRLEASAPGHSRSKVGAPGPGALFRFGPRHRKREKMPAGSQRSRPFPFPGRCAGPRCTLPVHPTPPQAGEDAGWKPALPGTTPVPATTLARQGSSVDAVGAPTGAPLRSQSILKLRWPRFLPKTYRFSLAPAAAAAVGKAPRALKRTVTFCPLVSLSFWVTR